VRATSRLSLWLVLLAVAGHADARREHFPHAPEQPLAATTGPLAVFVAAPQRYLLVARKNDPSIVIHSLTGPFGRIATTPFTRKGQADAAGEVGRAFMPPMMAAQGRGEQQRADAMVELVGPVLADVDWSPMLTTRVERAFADTPLGKAVVIAHAQRESAPEDTARSLYLLGGHQFSSDARYLMVHLVATLCDGRNVINEHCGPLYRNELTYVVAVPEVVRQLRNEKRALAWQALGRDGFRRLVGAAFDELVEMLEYDLAHFGFEKKRQLLRQVPGPWRNWPARDVDHEGARNWYRDAYGRLYSLAPAVAQERGR
jgi:hypothetical protein